jgi:isopentenyl-diphosphate Delta-isomerase
MGKDQIISAVDENGNFLEYISKIKAHTGDGIHHLAITVFVYNSIGQVLLQKRKHKVFDNIWENTASTHQLHKEDGTDETDVEATLRALKREYGIKEIKLQSLGGFNYFEKVGDLCENEFCKLLIGEYNGEVQFNPQVGYEIKWMDKKEFLIDLENNPKSYTPWTVASVKLLEDKNFFG